MILSLSFFTFIFSNLEGIFIDSTDKNSQLNLLGFKVNIQSALIALLLSFSLGSFGFLFTEATSSIKTNEKDIQALQLSLAGEIEKNKALKEDVIELERKFDDANKTISLIDKKLYGFEVLKKAETQQSSE